VPLSVGRVEGVAFANQASETRTLLSIRNGGNIGSKFGTNRAKALFNGLEGQAADHHDLALRSLDICSHCSSPLSLWVEQISLSVATLQNAKAFSSYGTCLL
jgi:hypothetical protein